MSLDLNDASSLNKMRDTVDDLNNKVGWRDNSRKIRKVLSEYAPELLPIFENYLIATSIALMHSELSEILEAARKNLMDDHLPHRRGIEAEAADVFIRLMDFSGQNDLDIGGAVLEKFEYNKNRADHKPENRNKEGGKKF